MKVKKAISIALLSCLFINTTIPSFASTLSDDGRYEAFEGNNFTINDILEEDKVDVEIEGNTMINVFDYDNMRDLPETENSLGYSLKGREVTFRYNDSLNIDYNISWDSADEVIQKGETYTFICDITKNTLSSRAEVYPFLWDFAEWNKGGAYIQSGYTGKSIVSFKASKDFPIKLLYRGYNSTLTGEISMSDIMLLKGDYYDNFIHDNKNIPSYFEGIKSVGQDDENGHNIEVISNNKNLIEGIEFGLWNFTLGAKDIDNNQYFARSTNMINCKPNTNYKFSGTAIKIYGGNLAFYDKNMNYLGDDMQKFFFETFTTPNNASYMCFHIQSNSHYLNDINGTIQLEENTKSTDYIEHQSNTLQIPLSEPLRSLPNGVKDRIIKRNGQWLVERRCGETILNGDDNEEWIFESDWTGNSDELSRFHIFIPNQKYILWKDLMYESKNYSTNNRFNTLENLVNTYDSGVEHFSGWDLGKFVLNIKTSRLSIENESGLKQWLSENPIEVVYELETPIYEPLNIDPTVNLYLDITHILNNSNIPASMKVVTDRVANRALEAIELAKSTPTVDSISQARYWANLMRESSLKDNFQSEIDNITEMEGLTIEKKTASVNADVYIKMKNTLSLSLDTNSIVFDEVDVTEDTEMQNAVNLSISSSLPYKVNAYLEDEIYNSDKSNKLDKSILNIRANGEALYQAFTDLSTPIVLLDDQEAGVDAIHGIDLRLASNNTHKADIYKTSIKFEVIQK